MQILLDLSEQDYKLACKYPDVLIGSYSRAIANGIPLSKDHKRLSDADEIIDKLKGVERLHIDNELRTSILDAINTSIILDTEEHSCSKCRYLGWENVGEGMNPVCEQELYMDVDKETGRSIGLYKSEPTIADKNNCCYWRAKEVKE